MNLPADLDSLHSILKQRIRDQDRIEDCRADAAAEQRRIIGAKSAASQENRHIVGQTGCFCLDCMLFRKQDWRIGDENPALVGPRDKWRQYTWGNAERRSLFYTGCTDQQIPVKTPAIKETISVHSVRRGRVTTERDAKFVAVASGKYHTLLLSESSRIFSCGDNSYGALGHSPSTSSVASPKLVSDGLSDVKGIVKQIAASSFASFALVVLPINNSTERVPVDNKRARGRRGSIDALATRFDLKVAAAQNHVFSWGRGDRGVLGHGDKVSYSIPRILRVFDSKRVVEISPGAQHVLVLTEIDGVFAFGDGSHGKLGLGDMQDRCSPVRISSLDALNVIHVCAGDDHSIAVTGDTFFDRQVYSWGLGMSGRLGHGDEESRLKPTRINHFRGRKVITVAAGGTHNLALSEMSEGVCVWSWGCGTYGQLGHRDTWDVLIPRSIDTIRRENIRFISAGARHSLAISDEMTLWVWGQGIHGETDVREPDLSSSSVLHPVKVNLPDMILVSALAGRGRTFAWGDRALNQESGRAFGGTSVEKVCCALPKYESLSSDSFRIFFRCGPCNLPAICIACAHHCHVDHCLELKWTLENSLDRSCNCIDSSEMCVFAAATTHPPDSAT